MSHHSCPLIYLIYLIYFELILDPRSSILDLVFPGNLLNRSIVSSVSPTEWKSTKVIPLFKKGERSDLNNYRPISIIPVVAEVFQRIVYNQFYEYSTENNLISCDQSGFRSLHSTATALPEATDNWAFNIDKGNVNAVIFLDLKKAFDTLITLHCYLN